ncbi:hypothetical protein Hdeb2414_s0072g00774411 [Helianthus debilis subsp. tardiflorus]
MDCWTGSEVMWCWKRPFMSQMEAGELAQIGPLVGSVVLPDRKDSRVWELDGSGCVLVSS